LDSLLRSFIDAEREVKLFIENSKTRLPAGAGSFFSVQQEADVDPIFRGISRFPALDFIQITLSIERYCVILRSLPPFVPFSQSSTAQFEANGWKTLLTPADFLATTGFAFLHFDLGLKNETSVLRFLASETRGIVPVDTPLVLTNRVLPDDRKTARAARGGQEEEEEEEDNASGRLSQGSRGAGGTSGDLADVESNGSRVSGHAAAAASSRKAGSRQSAATDTDSAGNRHSAPGDADSGRSARSSKSAASARGGRASSVKSGHLFEPRQEPPAEEDLPVVKKPRRRRRRHRDGEPAPEPEPEPEPSIPAIDVDMELDGEPEAPTEETIQFEEDGPEESPELEIRRFVAELPLNIPAFADPSVFSTLIQQLFYERWKSVALSKARATLDGVRHRMKQRTSGEIQGLRDMVDADDPYAFVRREEQKLQRLETMSVDTLEKVLEKRCTSYSNGTTPWLLQSFQTICGDHVTLQRRIRKKRAEIREQTLELRVAQARRIEKLQVYHKRVGELEAAASAQARMRAELDPHEKLEAELMAMEADRQALLQQREKVKGMLEAKRAERQAEKLPKANA
jgi:hypothetical protein